MPFRVYTICWARANKSLRADSDQGTRSAERRKSFAARRREGAAREQMRKMGISRKYFTFLSGFVLSVTLLLVLAAPAQAQRMGGGEQRRFPPGRGEGRAPMRHGPPANRLLRLLNLTPEQQRQMREIRAQGEGEIRAARLRFQRAQLALDQAIYADTVDEALIEERAREVGEAQSQLVRLRALTEMRIRRVLTPEQLSTYRDLRLRALNEMRQRPNRRLMPQQTGEGEPR